MVANTNTRKGKVAANATRWGLLGALVAGLLAAAGTAANADECCRWELKVKRKAVLSDNFTVELWAHFPDSGYAFAGGRVDILSEDIDWISTELCGPMFGPGTSPGGMTVGDDVVGIIVNQLNFPPAGVFADPSNPILAWCGEFEASGTGFRTLRTETDSFGYYPERESSISVSCTPIEAKRTVFVGPIVIDDWIVSPFPGVGGDVSEGGIELFPLPGGASEIAAGIQADDTAITETGQFEIEHTVSFDPASVLDVTWFPRPWCRWIDPWITMRVTAPRTGVVDIAPDLTAIGATTVPIVAYLDGMEVGSDVVPTGGSFKVLDPCTSLTWCWVEGGDGWPVLVLKCDTPFDVELSGIRVRADSIEFQARELRGAPIDLDRIEVRARGMDSLTIVDAGLPASADCFADCTGDGELNIFDFLCFQNLFVSGDLGADCTGDGELNIFDFLCFQNAFIEGCQ